jgi:Mrp family chromosome partitioning ATPase
MLEARGGGSVCLVDANTAGQRFGSAHNAGLAELVRDPDCSLMNTVSRVPGRQLWILKSGAAAYDHSRRMAGSDNLRRRIDELRASFSFVLVDAAPFDKSHDALTLGALADGLVLGLRANRTRRDTARLVKQEIEAAKVKLLGAILVDRTFPVPEAIYKWL